MRDLFDMHAPATEKVALGTDAVVLLGDACSIEVALVTALHTVTTLAPF